LTPATGIKRLGLALLAGCALAAGVLTAASLLISADSVRTQVMSEIRAVTGLNPTLRGEATVSLFPSGRVSFADVVLGDGDKPAMTAERLTAHLRFFPLLIGRVEIADVALESPTIAVDFDDKGGSNWSTLVDALARSQNSGAHRLAPFSEIRISNGTVVVRDAQRKLTETLQDMRLSLAWPSISKSFGATGRFIWHDEPVDVSLTLADFAAALAGNRSGVKLRLAGAPLKCAFEGSLSVKPTLRIEGTLAADADSLREALVWFGQKPLPGGGFGHFSIKAQTNVVSGTVGLTGVNVELDGNTAEGVLTFASDPRQTLQGTLAAETLDLTPYVSTVKLLTANQREWSNAHITLDGLANMDLDLRLSAAKVIISTAKLGRTAIGANLRAGHLVVTVGEAQAYGGVIKGSVTMGATAKAEAGVDLRSQLQFTDVDLDSALGQLFGLHRLEGKGNMSLSVEGSGDSVMGVTRTLTGNATLTGQDGAVLGFDVEQLLRRLERRPLSGGGEFRSGTTPFDKMTVALKIVNGTANVEDMKIVGAAVTIGLTGSASIPKREFDLNGSAALVAAARPGVKPFDLPFVVQGSWDDPIILPDAEALIRRSGAAAPLLNAARERERGNSVVRSVIERLTGGSLPGASPPAQPQPAAAPTADAVPPTSQ
jgi:AsmA protein